MKYVMSTIGMISCMAFALATFWILMSHKPKTECTVDITAEQVHVKGDNCNYVVKLK